MSKKNKTFVATIYGYDTMNHEKYCFSIDHFIDNYKEFAKDNFFWIFHSKKERDSFAFKCYKEELLSDASDYLDGLKEINLDKAVSS